MLIVVVYRTVIQLLPILNNLSFLLFKDIYYSDYFIVINIRLVFMRLASHNVITLVLNFKSLVLCSWVKLLLSTSFTMKLWIIWKLEYQTETSYGKCLFLSVTRLRYSLPDILYYKKGLLSFWLWGQDFCDVLFNVRKYNLKWSEDTFDM